MAATGEGFRLWSNQGRSLFGALWQSGSQVVTQSGSWCQKALKMLQYRRWKEAGVFVFIG
jgi:hypothetical protein